MDEYITDNETGLLEIVAQHEVHLTTDHSVLRQLRLSGPRGSRDHLALLGMHQLEIKLQSSSSRTQRIGREQPPQAGGQLPEA